MPRPTLGFRALGRSGSGATSDPFTPAPRKHVRGAGHDMVAGAGLLCGVPAPAVARGSTARAAKRTGTTPLMPTITVPTTGIEIFYEDSHQQGADPRAEVMLLVIGLGAQLTFWPEELVTALVGEGFRVIRYDNRDTGLSQKMGDARPPSPLVQVLRQKIGVPARVPYTLRDMAEDGIGLLDALGIGKAHVVGASMGGAIVQLMAIHHPDRVQTMTSIMSTTGNPGLPQADRQAMKVLTTPVRKSDEESLVAHALEIERHIGSPGFPCEPDVLRERVLGHIRRSVYPLGMPRQLAAILDDGCRRARLASVRTPTLVLHGEADPLIRLAAGEDTARHIAGSRLVTIPGWAHDLPPLLMPRIAAEIVTHARERPQAMLDAGHAATVSRG